MNMIIEPEKLKQIAPSIYAESSHSKLTEKYKFIPTSRVLEVLEMEGWNPVFARQTNCKTENGQSYTKHMVRLANTEAKLNVGDSRAELIITNSHDGTSAYKIAAGLYRLVCSNGMMVSESTFETISIRHSGYADEKVISASNEVMKALPLIESRVNLFKTKKIDLVRAMSFASRALAIKWDGEEAPIKEADLLKIRRVEDNGNSLWQVFNRIQENLIRGGLRYSTSKIEEINGRAYTSMRRMRTRGVNSIKENIRINTELWELADEIALLS